MPECSYCGEFFDSEEAELQHLRDEHAGELSRIDRRRVGDVGDGDGGLPTGPIVLAGVILVAIAVVFYVIVVVGGGSGQEPGPAGSAHDHGTMEMVVMGEAVDFSQRRYQGQDPKFHFEPMNGEPNGRIWHAHATRITLEWAMDTLGIEVTESTVTFQGTTYRDSDPTTEVLVEVNGDPVDPAEYVLEGPSDPSLADQGDSIRIVVRSTNGSN